MLTAGTALSELELNHALFGIPGLEKLIHVAGDTPEKDQGLVVSEVVERNAN